MWPFGTSGQKANDVELPSDTSVLQTNMNPPDPPSTVSQASPMASQEQHSRPSAYYRLGMHPSNHVTALSSCAAIGGLISGMKKGALVASLCFRAENAHLTPTSKAGWFLYNKSKNYHTIVGGAKQGLKTGAMYFGWASLFLTLELGLDLARGRIFASKKEKAMDKLASGQADFLNTVSAAVAVAGIYSRWKGMDRWTTARMTRGAIMFGVPFGLGQDLFAWARGEGTWYTQGLARLLGTGGSDYEQTDQQQARSV